MRTGELIVGRFEIQAFAGEGGMGAVYRALDRQTGKLVALKRVAAHGETEARFFREARALATLNHPAIVAYVAHGAAGGGEAYLAMEWLEGETLRSRLGRGALGVRDSVDLARRVAAALDHAHRLGVVHRDLSPANILLVDGRIDALKLLDFGLARLHGDNSKPGTPTETLLGTLAYMAPEQARGTEEVDARADLFSLGCVLFECVSGQSAFGADSYLATLAKIVVADAPRLRDLAPEAPAALDELLARLLAKEPADRPPNAESVIETLHGLTGSRPSLRSATSTDTLALTERERVLTTVLVAGQPGRGAADAESPASSAQAAALAERARAAGARLERLTTDAWVATLSGRGAAGDQATRAARLALELRQILSGTPVAIATGWAMVSGVAPVGAVVERATALLAHPLSGPAVRVDDVTAGLLPGRFQLTADPASLVLLSERSDETPVRKLLGRTTPCVGRDRELRTLHAIVDESLSAPVAQAVLLTGPSGIGKSRIRYELVGALAASHADLQTWVGRGDPMRAGSPFAILGRALRSAAGVSEGEPEAVQVRKLGARVARHLPPADQERVVEFLSEMLGLRLDAPGSARLRAARQDPVLMGDQIRSAWDDFLGAELGVHPVLLVLEDFQWGDAATVKLIDSTLRVLAERPLIVLAVARPDVREVFPNIWAERGAHEIRVGGLTRRAAEGLTRELLGDLEPTLLAGIVQRAQGNAFYLEELIRAHAEGRGDSLPDTIVAMVKGRIEAMEPEARRVLRAGSVFGQTFWSGAVAALLGGPSVTAEIAEWLGILEQREVVSPRMESRFGTEREYVFRHALVRDAAYAMLTEADRKLGHCLAAEWLEGAGDRDAALLAEQFERGGAHHRAVAWWHRAADDALEANDFDAAVLHAERGLSHAPTGAEAAGLELTRAEALRLRGDVAEAAEGVGRALAGYEPGSPGWCNAAAERALVLQRLGRARELETASDDLLSVEPAPEAEDALAMARVRTALALLRVGERERAHELVDAAERTRGPTGPVTQAWIHAFHSIDGLLAGDRARYLSEARAALAHHEEVGDVRPALEQSINIASMYLELGAYEQAEGLLRDALAKAERLGIQHAAAGAQHNLGLVLAYLGRLDDALALERAALEAFHGRDLRLEGGARWSLAVIHMLAGRTDAAAREAEVALELLREAAPPLVPTALATLAEVRLGQDRGAEALALAREAADALLVPGGVEHGELLVRRVLAECLAARGDLAAAKATIEAARARLQEQADGLHDDELRRSLIERVPDHRRIAELASSWAAAG